MPASPWQRWAPPARVTGPSALGRLVRSRTSRRARPYDPTTGGPGATTSTLTRSASSADVMGRGRLSATAWSTSTWVGGNETHGRSPAAMLHEALRQRDGENRDLCGRRQTGAPDTARARRLVYVETDPVYEQAAHRERRHRPPRTSSGEPTTCLFTSARTSASPTGPGAGSKPLPLAGTTRLRPLAARAWQPRVDPGAPPVLHLGRVLGRTRGKGLTFGGEYLPVVEARHLPPPSSRPPPATRRRRYPLAHGPLPTPAGGRALRLPWCRAGT